MKKIATIAFAASILAASSFGIAKASEDSKAVSGGWSESKGYFVNSDSDYLDNTESLMSVQSITPYASSTPDSHTGKRLTKVIDSAGTEVVAAWGKTVWKGQPHYTTARMETKSGTVLSTSGRQFWDGVSTSEATSPYIHPEWLRNEEARSYWSIN